MCAENVGFKKQAWIGDAAIHVAFGSKIHHIVGVIYLKYVINKCGVVDIASEEFHIGQFQFGFNGLKVSGVGESVKDKHTHLIGIFCKNIFHKIGTNESGTACHKVSLHLIFSIEYDNFSESY